MTIEVRTVAAKLNKLQKTLKAKVESTALYNEVKKKVRTSNDLKKVVAIVEQRKKQVEKIAKELPREIKIVKSYLESQRKELEKMGNGLLAKVKAAKATKSGKSARPAARTTTKKRATKKSARN
jgi:hypothetical protein